MKLEAKTRLQATTISREQKANLPAIVTPLVSPLGIHWLPVREINMGDLYPRIGTIKPKKGNRFDGHFSISLGNPDMANGLALQVHLNVDLSNSIYRGDANALAYALAATAEFAKVLKKIGKITEVPARGKVPVPGIRILIPTKKLDLAATQKYGIQVIDTDGKPHVFTSTPHSYGPWDKDTATMNIRDLQHHLEYNDDFKRATDFRVVPV